MELHSRAPCQKALCVLEVKMGSRERWTMYRNHILLQKSLNWKWLGAGKCGGNLFLHVSQCFFTSMALHFPFHSELQNHKIISVERPPRSQSPAINPALPCPNKSKPQQYNIFCLRNFSIHAFHKFFHKWQLYGIEFGLFLLHYWRPEQVNLWSDLVRAFSCCCVAVKAM